MKKKLMSILLLIFVSAYILTGCSSSDSDTKNNKNQSVSKEDETTESDVVELKIWVEEDNFDNVNKMLDSFKEYYKGQATFEITLEAQADSATRNNLLGDVHNGADVFSMPDDQLYSMISGGALSPVADADTIRNENLEEAIEAASYNGTLYAYPYSADNGYFLYYDKNYYNEDDVKTLDKILQIAEKEGKKFSMEFNSGWYMYAFFGGTGLEFGINDDGVTNYCNWNSTENTIKGVDVAKSLLKITSSPAFLSEPNDNFAKSISSGKAIAGVSGVWHAMTAKEVWGDDYGACKLPTYTCAGQQVQMSTFTGYKMMGVNAYSKHPEWAHKLAKWLTNEENQTLRFVERNQGPSNINAAASDEVQKVPAITAVIEQSQYGTLQRVGNNYWTPCSEFAEIILAGNSGKIPLQELMDTLAQDISASVVK